MNLKACSPQPWGLQTPRSVRESNSTPPSDASTPKWPAYQATHLPSLWRSGARLHDRVLRDWRHLDFFQFGAWLHADVPRVKCDSCGETGHVAVPWVREGSAFTLLFEALALSLCRERLTAQVANLLRVVGKRLWTRIDHYIRAACSRDDMSGTHQIGIDETSVKKGREYITVVHDLEAKRLLFTCPGRGHETMVAFAQDLTAPMAVIRKWRRMCAWI